MGSGSNAAELFGGAFAIGVEVQTGALALESSGTLIIVSSAFEFETLTTSRLELSSWLTSGK